jgi:hypothetical protein
VKTQLDFLGMHVNVATQSRRRWLVVAIYAVFAGLVIGWCAFAGFSWYGWLALLVFALIAKAMGGKTYRTGLVPAMASVGFKRNEFYPHWDPAVRGFVDHLPYGLLIAAGILYYTLPQAILLWTEPDMEAEGAGD